MPAENMHEKRQPSKLTLKNRKNRKKQVLKRKEDKLAKEQQMQDLITERDVLLARNTDLKRQRDEKIVENESLKKKLEKAENEIREYQKQCVSIQEGELLLLESDDYDM